MITINPLALPSNRRRDGTIPVYVRVYYAGRSRRIPTNVVCRPSDLTRGGKLKSAEVLEAANNVIARMRLSLADVTPGDLEGRDVDWVVDRIVRADRRRDFRLDFFAFSEGVLAEKSPGARGQYVTALNVFAEFLGKRELDVNAVTRPLLQEFLSWLRPRTFQTRNKRLSPATRTRIPNGAESRHIARLAHLYNRAKDRYNDEDSGLILIPRNPFKGMGTKHPPSRGQKSLGVELMQRVIDGTHPLQTVRTALDLFVLSFALMGANLADLYEAGSLGDVWVYHRRKTRTRRADGAEMRVSVPDCVRGRLDALERLRTMAGKPEYATAKVNKGLARWCKDNEIPVFTFYAARHTFATLCRKAGVEKATVDECLCHVGDYRLTDIYAERSWELMDAANARVLDLFRW